MNNPRATQLVPIERVERLIHLARGEKVLLDADLAKLYGVTTGALNRAVKRNANRFPADFMFELTTEEADILKCQSGISSYSIADAADQDPMPSLNRAWPCFPAFCEANAPCRSTSPSCACS